MSLSIDKLDYYIENYFVEKQDSVEAYSLGYYLQDPENCIRPSIKVNQVTDDGLNDIDLLLFIVDGNNEISADVRKFILDNLPRYNQSLDFAKHYFTEDKAMQLLRKWLTGSKLGKSNLTDVALKDDVFLNTCKFVTATKRGSNPLAGQQISLMKGKSVSLMKLESFLNKGGILPVQVVEANRKLNVYTPEKDNEKLNSNLLYSVIDTEGNRVVTTSKDISSITNTFDNGYSLIRKEALMYTDDLHEGDIETLINLINKEKAEKIEDITKPLNNSILEAMKQNREQAKTLNMELSKEEKVREEVSRMFKKNTPEEVKEDFVQVFLTKDTTSLDLENFKLRWISEEGYNNSALVLTIASKLGMRKGPYNILTGLLDKGYTLKAVRNVMFLPNSPSNIMLYWLLGKPIYKEFIQPVILARPKTLVNFKLKKEPFDENIYIPQLRGVKVFTGKKITNGDKISAERVEIQTILNGLDEEPISNELLELNPVLDIRDCTDCDFCGMKQNNYVAYLPNTKGEWSTVCPSCLKKEFKHLSVGKIFVNRKYYIP